MAKYLFMNASFVYDNSIYLFDDGILREESYQLSQFMHIYITTTLLSALRKEDIIKQHILRHCLMIFLDYRFLIDHFLAY